MKIALSTRSFQPPVIGGVDVYTDRLGKALERRGEEVLYLAFNSSKEYSPEIQVRQESYEGRRIWRCLFDFTRRPPELYQLGYDPEMGECIRSILKAEQPDLLIIMNFYMSTLAGVAAAKALSIPVVHVATDYLPICRRATMIRWNGRSCQVGESIKSCSDCFISDRSIGRLAARTLNLLPEKTLVSLAELKDRNPLFLPLRALNPYWRQVNLMKHRLEVLEPLKQEVDLVLAPTRYTARMFRENGFRDNQVEYLPFGVESDSPLAKVNHEPADHMRFLFIGRLQPYKGAHLLVDAFNQLTSPKDATLTIYGIRDGYDAYYEELIARIAKNNRIQFKGRIAAAELGNAIAEADYFVLPSTWHENSPLIVLDALQSRTPVIASEIGGVTDLVNDGVNGLLFPMGDVAGLAAVMQKAIDHPEFVDRFRAQTELTTIEDYTDKMLALCNDRHLL
jgi:glycosyltransferase involved in cell wall biosynthesis